jgi:hypothetical protein
VLFEDRIVADHPRQFRRDQIVYDPWHYLPVLLKKPGSLRNGAPFNERDLPPYLAQVRAGLKRHDDGDRQFVKVLSGVLDHRLDAVEAACAEALEAGIHNGDVILAILARQLHPQLIGVQIIRSRSVRRSPGKGGEMLHVADVGLLRLLGEATDMHVLDHPLTQRG